MDPVATGTQAVEELMVDMTLTQRFEAGGWFMWPILVLGIVAVLIVIERIYKLYVQININKPQLLSEVRNAIYSGRLMLVGQTIAHQIIQAGFQAFEKSQKDSELQLAIDAAATKHFPSVEKNTSYLTMIANVCTLLGLLGTISGLIKSFAAAAKADPAQKAELLARGIAEAMNCTGFGLMIAIACLGVFSFLQGRTQKIIDDINEVVLESMNFVVSHKEKLRGSKGGA